MDSAKLELAVQRCREAEDAVVAAREDVRAEAVRLMQEVPGGAAEAEVARLTGWDADVVRRLAV
ncbi:hypothetical protein [Streptomyces avicenniae]|uniref:hypothetical protein n=1 Tax=Streptomyces avicenniae TaxID=500153 RepID=UPI00069AE418|nr:hypothetical protein [Streptomyces avicenniae]